MKKHREVSTSYDVKLIEYKKTRGDFPLVLECVKKLPIIVFLDKLSL